MGKIRVYKLAEDLGLESSEVIDILNELGEEVSSHMSTVEDETADLVAEMVNEEAAEDTKTESGDDVIELETSLTVKELAEEMGEEPNSLMQELVGLGIMATINQELDEETIETVLAEYGYEVEFKTEEEEEGTSYNELVQDIDDDPEDIEERAPVVTVMGHVDHGKTTLLDAIRETNVTESEAGGITQHIGAYQVDVDGEKITFLDTPGHEAFTSLRARGAQVTDVAILIIAADDGVMPQTVEAINHAKAADVPIIVAINKVDKHNAQPERVKQELTEYELVPEEWGGNTICVPISALQKQNIDELLEMVILVSEMEELKANHDRPANGVVVEAELDKGRGPVATVLIKNGTLKIGDPIVAGLSYGTVKALVNDQGERVKKAGPAMPVGVLGFNSVPQSGDLLQVLEDEREVRKLAERRQDEKRQEDLSQKKTVTLDDLYDQIQEGEIKDLNIIIKGDVQGSVEAIKEALLQLSTDEVQVNVVHSGVGAVREADIMLATASNAIVIGFNVRPDDNARQAAEKEQVDIRTYRVIYKAIEDIRAAMEGMLEPDYKEIVLGRADVRDTFSVPKVGTIAGIYVTDGKVNRNANARLLRDNVVIFEGDIASLKRFEDDVREVDEGYECGLGLENFNDIKVGDTIEIYDYKEIKRTL
ncbi:translation initiation factor IF-2 [Acetohalobium arabaticum]|uniref:Translation initiation factor IF-2 n=1 Tax=Acetohalobium arabaticum (strain ATCC 49924 / DSM 5501 / Z-7288) TaxID=574087 RepID=D9QRG1_ACEAZ|nr:translation initiation factor IF-2 [Acetohalobium arabaticum]ADL13102.1 bacterial translation initiation factor 2 (bIF-2) [Acetohalobium arabaticum DSM 5501]